MCFYLHGGNSLLFIIVCGHECTLFINSAFDLIHMFGAFNAILHLDFTQKTSRIVSFYDIWRLFKVFFLYIRQVRILHRYWDFNHFFSANLWWIPQTQVLEGDLLGGLSWPRWGAFLLLLICIFIWNRVLAQAVVDIRKFELLLVGLWLVGMLEDKARNHWNVPMLGQHHSFTV